MLQTVDSPLSSRLLLSKIDVRKLKKAFLEELVKDSPSHSQTANELDAQVYSLFIVRADLASGRDFHLAAERAELSDFEFYCIFE